MDAEQRRQFAAKGYLIIPAALSSSALRDLNAEYDRRLATVRGEIERGAADAAEGADIHSWKSGRSGNGGFGLGWWPNRGQVAPTPALRRLLAPRSSSADDTPAPSTCLVCHLRRQESRQVVDDHGNRYSGSRFWSRAYADLVDNPVMLPYLEELLGDPAWGHAPPRLPDALRTRIRLDHEDISYKPPMRPEQADLGGDLHGSPSNTHITVRLPPSLPTHPSRARALRAAPHHGAPPPTAPV